MNRYNFGGDEDAIFKVEFLYYGAVIIFDLNKSRFTALAGLAGAIRSLGCFERLMGGC